ncbi:hypothetical protein GQ53DRAFT_740116, partial [Thozetella sp. PMI_491]
MEEIDVSTLQSFSKIWKEKNTWTGAQYDILDSKVKQFLLCSRKLKIRLSQLHTVFDQMLGGEALQYFLNHMNPEQPFATLYMEIRRHYDTEMNRALYHNDWSSLTLNILRGKPEMAGKSSQEVLQALFNKLQLCQRALGEEYQTEQQLVDTTLRAVSGIRELSIALSKPERSFEALCSSLRSALQTAENTNSSTMESFFVDRRFQRATERSKSPFQSSRPFQTNKLSSNGRKWTGKCWCCKKIGCYSKNHTEAEQAKAKEEWKLQRSFENKPKQGYRAYLTAYEGPSPHETFLEEQHSSDPDDLSSEEESEGESKTAAWLTDSAFQHALQAKMRNAPPNHCQSDREKRTNEVFMLDKYSEAVFQGIMPDTGAAEKSTAGMRQFQALQRQLPTISLNRDRAGEARIRFGSGDPLESVGTTIVSTPIGQITFHVVETPTPFLLCLKDMDDLSTELHNVRNELVRADGVRVPVCRKWGHAWFYPDGIGTSTDGVDELARAVFLTETELRRVHRRFGHPSVGKMYKFLTGAG